MTQFPHNTGGQRPTAYKHMKPFERAASFIGCMLHFYKENISRMEEEMSMWNEPVLIQLIGADDCRDLRWGVENQLKTLKADQEVWQKRLDMMGVCKGCSGQGWYWTCIAQDESVRTKCGDCDGHGMTPQSRAVVAAVEAQQLAAAANAAAAASVKPPSFLQNVGRKFR